MLRPTIGEEIFSSVTHGVGAIAALVGLVILETLAIRSGNIFQIIAFSIYGGFLFLLFLSSTLYHGIQVQSVKRVFRLFDHVLIYLFIAGTYTPILALIIKSNVIGGWLFLGIVWGLALMGVFLKIFLINKPRFIKVDVWLYLFLGWFVVFILPIIYKFINMSSLILLIGGGLFYTIGTIFYRSHKLKFHHAYWHLFVICGSLLHYLVILRTS